MPDTMSYIPLAFNRYYYHNLTVNCNFILDPYDVGEVATYTKKLREKAESSDATELDHKVLEAAQQYLELREYIDQTVRHYALPSSDRLLPDLPPGLNHVRTLVLDLDELLVHSDWTRERGWRTFKRPGVEIFLQHMGRVRLSSHHILLQQYSATAPNAIIGMPRPPHLRITLTVPPRRLAFFKCSGPSLSKDAGRRCICVLCSSPRKHTYRASLPPWRLACVDHW
eukprot:899928-Prorocentrum_minimum.AAC.4